MTSPSFFQEPLKACVGLGNPGAPYHSTRHNVGFLAIDALRTRASHNQGLEQARFSGLLSHATIEAQTLLLFKPTTYMNLSGRALVPFMQFYKLKPEQLLVIHDDLDLAFGDVRLKNGGGSAGHNGLKSLDAAIGNNYCRMRIGIGRPPHPHASSVSSYVLSAFTKEELHWLDALLLRFAQHFANLLKGQERTFLEDVRNIPPPP